MKPVLFSPRAAALPLALAAAFPSCFAQTVKLPDTLVTATRFAESEQSLPLGVSVITADEIRASGATTINEALMRILGVVGRQDFLGGGEYNLDLRGFGGTSDSNQVVIVDGLRYSEADISAPRLANIPIESVDRIEVLRGSGAVLYGEGATGGVIIITTKPGIGAQRKNSASVYAGGGSYGLRDLRASATAVAGDFSLDVSGQKRDSDNHRDNFASSTDAASVTGQWSRDGLRAGVRLAGDALNSRLPGALTAAQYEENPRQTTTPDDKVHIRNNRASLFANAQLGNWEIGGDVGQRTKGLTSLNSGFPFDYDVDATTYSLKARHEAPIGSARNVLMLGVDGMRWKREVLGAFGSTANEDSRGVYVRDSVRLANGLRIDAGVRAEKVDKDNTGATSNISDRLNAWELGASAPLAGATVYARAGQSFRLANVDEFNFTSPGVTLLPQTSKDYEIGARWSYAGGKAELRAYRSNLTNEIGFDPNAAGPFGFGGANVNLDPTRRQGLELDTRHQLARTFELRINAALRRATFRSGPYAGTDVPQVPRESLAVRGDWTPAPGHRLNGGINWVGTQHPDFGNSCTMPAYSTVDLRYAYQWKQLELSVGVTNLFDRKYFTQAFGCTPAGVTTSIYPDPGRSFTAGLRVGF